MMEEFAALLTLAGLVAFGLTAVSFFKPLPKLKLATRQASALLAAASLGSCVAAAALMPSPGPGAPGDRNEDANIEVSRSTPDEIAQATAEIAADSAARDARIPAEVPPSPVVAFCPGSDTKVCDANRLEFERKDWPRAWGGDYQAQRNVAFCLADGCESAVRVNKVLACAWRQVIQLSGDIEVGQGDLNNLEIHCYALDPDSRAAARAQAEAIFKTVYKRDMPTPDDW